MHSKNNLEEFFKHTINKFNDTPSDKVWEGLEQRLEPQHTLPFNSKMLLPFLMVCLIVISTFSVIGNINLHQKTEKLTAQMQEKESEIEVIQSNFEDVLQMYLSVEDYVEINCKPTMVSPYSQEIPFRDEDIIPIREL